ncbi:MAG: hypothetical protein M1330_02870 [Armatimonadetes bacterium]|nr:hypothetical protein [Armatimonadota bacterium]
MPACNIDHRGRFIRLGGGVISLLMGGTLFLLHLPKLYDLRVTLVVLLAAGGTFSLYEGLIGWCAIRALGIKTRW